MMLMTLPMIVMMVVFDVDGVYQLTFFYVLLYFRFDECICNNVILFERNTDFNEI